MLSANTFYVVTHGWPGLALAYASVQAPMMAGLARARATTRQWLLSPVLAAPLTAASGLGMAVAHPVLSGLGLASSGLTQVALGAGMSAALGYVAGRAWGGVAVHDTIHQRGALVRASPQRLTTRPRTSGAEAHVATLTLAGLPLSVADESKHFKLIGTTGTGKSTAITELLSGALARGDRAVIADPDGGYLHRFYDANRGDFILNPFDARSAKWDLFAEVRAPYDVEQLARSLLPDHEGTDRSWRGYARTFFTAVTRQAHAAGVRDVGELYRLLVVADTRELRTLTAGTPAQPFLEEHNGRMFESIRSVTSSAVGALEYVATQQGRSLSVRDWVQQGLERRGGVLFMPYRAGQIAALRSMISAWMRIAIFETMNRPESEQPLWFVVDELDALGQIDGLKDALARVRKFGGRCVLGFQSLAQVASTYGPLEAHTLVENCGNSLILRCSASEGGGTSRFASTLIGHREVVRTSASSTRRFGELLRSRTLSEQRYIEPAVMDAEIEQLPDLAGYLKFASHPQWLRVRLNAPAECRPRAPAAAPPAAAIERRHQSEHAAVESLGLEP